MRLQFDPNQAYQHDAIAAVTDLFDGQPLGQSEYSVIDMGHYADLDCSPGNRERNLALATIWFLARKHLPKMPVRSKNAMTSKSAPPNRRLKVGIYLTHSQM